MDADTNSAQVWEDRAAASQQLELPLDDEAFACMENLAAFSTRELCEAVDELFVKLKMLLLTYFNHHEFQQRKSNNLTSTHNKNIAMAERITHRMHIVCALLFQQTGT